ncbi:acetylornithine transaminase [Cellulomonas fulva]|uniref:acetylornithine transaminase n=1 Tax=Cellulomonas fulva TaxID=2835530 RepID=UPI001F024960|nr:acetylornithine transaminase [Cellulomonas fulva]
MSETTSPPSSPTSEPGPTTRRALRAAASTVDGLPTAAADGSVAQWTDRYTHAVMDTFGPPQRVLVRGEGPYVWDADGNRYLDLLGGIAVNSLGHGHPTLTAAISAQLGTLGHVSNFFGSPTQIAFAERLLQLAQAPDGSRVFLTNSGTEANEAAFKLARRTGRPRILALEGAFHGRTMGALALTHKAAYREPFEPLPGGVEWVPFGDVAALEAALAPGDVAALFVEPLQGEAGVLPLPPGYLAEARRLTARHGTLLVLDEVQTGMGRTGSWFAHQLPHIGGGVVPDAVTVAKGLGGGFPVGALLAFGDSTASLLGRGQHGSTFGGNPVASAAGLATIGVIERDGLLEHVTGLGARLRRRILDLDTPLVEAVRGEGLLIGIGLSAPVAPAVASRALAAGFIVNPVNPTSIRLAPPFVLTDEQAGTFVDFLAELDPAEVAA